MEAYMVRPKALELCTGIVYHISTCDYAGILVATSTSKEKESRIFLALKLDSNIVYTHMHAKLHSCIIVIYL